MPPVPSRLVLAPDARAAARELLERVARDAEAVRADPARLQRPLRVLVPAGALRETTLDALAQSGRALAGVGVQTLWSLALEVLEAAGRPVRTGAHLFELCVRRAVAGEAALAGALETFEDGAGLAAGAIGDLASAGLAEVDDARLRAALAPLAPRARERALALLRATRATLGELAAAGSLRHADVYGAAAALLAERPELCPSRGLVVHGFASATARARALLAALAATHDTTWIAVRPAGATAAEDLARRALPRGAAQLELAPCAAPRLSAYHATGFDDEARELALRVRALLDAGARPEGIAVVARALAPRATALRRAFATLGVPFAVAREPFGLQPSARRVAALLDVLREGPRSSVERWLDALGPAAGMLREDVRCALAGAGVLRLDALARLDSAAWVSRGGRVPLPARGALEDAAAPGERPVRRTLDAGLLREAAQRARAALELLAAWPDGAPPQRQRAALAQLAALAGMERDEDAHALWREIEELPLEFEGLARGPTRPELARALSAGLEGLDTPWLGGSGSGVRVLDAQAARGAAFEHLFVLGAERGVFPRAARGEALLGDAARAALAALAPELGTRASEEDEERWLLAALLGAAGEVTLAWRRGDLEGREIAASPAVLQVLAQAVVEPAAVERRRDLLYVRAPCSAAERALGTALVAPRARWAPALAAALEEAAERFGAQFLPRGRTAAELARARAAVLQELDPDRTTPRGLSASARSGPYLGLGGSGALPVAGGLFVTGLERLARCPWQAFLERGLGLEPAPDPLADLPDVDALALGNAVHAALQELALADGHEAADVERALERAARGTLEDAGVHLEGLALALARRARPLVARGLELAAAYAGPREAEVEGATPDGLRFRADLLAHTAEGDVRIDFKTGKPLSLGVQARTRRKALLAAVRRGTHLQAAAYAAAEGAARGVYLHLAAELDPDVARVEVQAGDAEVALGLRETADVLADAWRSGSVPPRAERPDGKPNDACARCAVRPACLRDDSGVRARLRSLAEGVGPGGSSDDLAVARLAGLWYLGGAQIDLEEE